MLSTIELDGKLNEELGFHVLRGSMYSVLPPTVDRTMLIPGRNGSRHFGSDLAARQFDFRCAIQSASAMELQQRVSELANFLIDDYGKPREMGLILLSQPDRYYTVRLSGDTSLDRIVGYGEFTLSLIADDPYSYLVDPILDSDILLDSDIRLDGESYGFFSLTGSTDGEVPNVGTLITRPTITVIGSFTNLAITVGSKTFYYTEAMTSKTLAIDGEALTVKVDGVNKLSKMAGDFIELLPGDNEITIGGAGLNCSVTVDVFPKFA